MNEEARKPIFLSLALFLAAIIIMLGNRVSVGADVIGETKIAVDRAITYISDMPINESIFGPSTQYGYVDNTTKKHSSSLVNPTTEDIAMNALDEITVSVSGMSFNEMERFLESQVNGQ